jgi:hypothetical protein
MASQPTPGPELVEEASAPQSNKQPAKPIKPLPSDRVNTAKQLDILRAFAAASNQGIKTVGNGDVASLTGMTRESISSCNAFFSSVGFIAKNDGSSWIVSPEVLAFQRAYDWNKDTAAFKLYPLVHASWFGQALATKLSFKPLSEDEAVAIFADIAVAAPEFKKSLKMLLEFMECAGVIQRAGDQIMLRPNPSVTANPEAPRMHDQAKEGGPEPPRSAPKVATTFAQMTEGGMRFNVSVAVDMAEMANWRPDRITAFFAGIAQVLAAKAEVEKTAKDG